MWALESEISVHILTLIVLLAAQPGAVYFNVHSPFLHL